MMRYIFGAVLAVALILLIALWLIGGGWTRIMASVHGTLNPFTIFLPGTNDEGTIFRLPWQPDFNSFGFDIDSIEVQNDDRLINPDPTTIVDSNYTPEEMSNYKNTVDDRSRIDTYGTPSPYARQIYFAESATYESDPNTEFIQLESATYQPVSMSGWSIESLASNKKVILPAAASIMVMGQVNTLRDIIANGNTRIFLTSGKSPVGASFQENSCTKYLEQFQPFVPKLTDLCASSRDVHPQSDAAYNNYGQSCFDFLQSSSQCTFIEQFPSHLSPACRVFIQNRFTYNGCVATHKNDPDFHLNVWRLYLNTEGELWNNETDILRLLDAEGRTVDLMRY